MRDLAALPKAHLHLHFTGSMRAATLADLAARHGVRLPAVLREGEPLRLEGGRRGWFRFQRLYDAARACVRSAEDLERIVHEAAADDAAEGSVRLELQIDPTSYAAHLGGITPVMEVVTAAARRASRETGVSVGVVVAASRMRHPLEARTLARLAARMAGDGPGDVVGFGLSNDERRGATAEFAPAFAIARRAGLASVPHGGELLGPGHVTEVLETLLPDRIGHGVRAAEDPVLVDRLARRGVTLELCPTSNVCLGVYDDAARVPLGALASAGVPLALGADDPLLFGSRLVDQYRLAREVHGLGDTALAALARSSILASRVSDSERAGMLAALDRWSADGAGTGPPPAA